ncbi:MMPL family transporter [Magnetospira sp. QH-2]|uniref:MMPL family transporter n=1 Tax=Magnetospira sp. (strain QH-2) TaxID=1288970 RepID=UPI0003E81595|nr:MMPL family transporter [Magnetospira sp. QH-2]CCQ73418.1 Putative hopanoid biosynthesis associated RND transporter like protein HpnN [Magnetospira sp. QH-2]
MIDPSGDFWGRWVVAVSRHARLVVLACLLLTIGAAAHVVESFDISTDNTDMLSPDLPFRQRMIETKRLFPNSGDTLLVVVEADNADRVADGTTDLVARMNARPDLFRDVFEPGSDPFFRRNGLLYLETQELEDLGARLAAAQPFLGTLWRDPSLAALLGLLDQALAAENVPLDLAPVLNAIAMVAEDQVAGGQASLSWTDLMGGGGPGNGDKRRMILARPQLDYGSLAPAGPPMRFVREAGKALDLEVHLTGSVALDHEELGSVEEGMGWAGIVSLVLVLVLLGGALKSARLVSALLITLVAGLIWTASFAFLAVGQLNLISVAFAVLFIGLSVDFGIHFSLRFLEAFRGDVSEALNAAARATGGPLALCAIAAAIAFYAFLPTDYVGLAQLGLIAGSGMFIALFANLTLLPALMTLMPVKAARSAGPSLLARTPKARWVVVGAVLLAFVAAPLAAKVQFDFDPLHLKDPATDSVATLERLMAEGEINPYRLTILQPDLESATALAETLRGVEGLGEVRTLADYLPRDQDEKLALIDGLVWTIGPSLTGERAVSSDDQTLVRARDPLITRLKNHQGEAETRLAQALDALGRSLESWRVLEQRLLAGLDGRLESLRQSLTAEPVTLEDLPTALIQRERAIDGQVRVQVSLPPGPTDRETLRAFVERVRALAPNATGTPVTIIEAGNAVIGSFQMAGLLTVAGVAVLLWLVLRRARDLLLVAVPLLLAAELTAAGSVLFDLPFNFANVIVLPLLIGLGVASGIHLVTRARERAAGVAMMATSTPRAVLFSALTTIGSFGSIALSSHPGTASMGLLLTLAIALTLACTMTVLPAMLSLIEE